MALFSLVTAAVTASAARAPISSKRQGKSYVYAYPPPFTARNFAFSALFSCTFPAGSAGSICNLLRLWFAKLFAGKTKGEDDPA